MIGWSVAELERKDRVLGAVLVLLGTAGTLAVAVNGPAALIVAVAVLGFGGASTAVLLKVQQARTREAEERRTEWRLPPARLGEIREQGLIYDLGVDIEAPEPLEAIGLPPGGHPEYMRRGVDRELRARLQEANERKGASLVVVSGPSKAGKSRTLLEVASRALPDAWLLSPKSAEGVAKLARPRPPRGLGGGPCVIWLDDIEECARRDRGLNVDTMRAFGEWGRPVVILATQGGKGVALSRSTGFREIVGDLLARYPPLPLDAALDADEVENVRDRYPGAVVRIEREGLGEFMIAAPRLIDRLRNGNSLAGKAIVWAAIDARRTGLLRPLSTAELEQLYGHYLAGAPTSEAFARGLEWAAEPLYSSVALISRRGDRFDEYTPHDYVVDWANRQGHPIYAAIWEMVVEEYADGEEDLLRIAAIASKGGDSARAEAAWRRADSLGSGHAAAALGRMFENRGELENAESAYRRGERRGDAHVSGSLGLLLDKRGDLDAAEAALRRSDEGGDPQGACWNGYFLQWRRGDLDAAEAAFRRASARGHWHGSAQLGALLELEREEPEVAEVAYREADEHGDGVGARRLGLRLKDRDEWEEAEAAFRRADERRDARGSALLGELLERRGEMGEAEAAYSRAVERGDAYGMCLLGGVLKGRGEMEEAETVLRRAHDMGLELGTTRLADVLVRRGKLDEAERFLRAGFDRGKHVARELGELLWARDDFDDAESAFRVAGERGDAWGQLRLAEVLEERGEWDEAEDAMAGAEALAVEGHAAGDSQATYTLGVLRLRQEDLDGAERAFRRADELGQLRATVRLGWILAFQRGRTAEGLAVYRRADLRGSAYAANGVGVILRRRGRPAEAVEAFTRADKRGSAEGAFNLAEMLMNDSPGPELRRQVIGLYERARDRALNGGEHDLAKRASDAIEDSLSHG